MNSYTFEDPITAFTTRGFDEPRRQFGGLERVLVRVRRRVGLPRPRPGERRRWRRRRPASTDWHINADEPTVLDYNVEFKTPARSTRSTPRGRTARPTTTRSSSALDAQRGADGRRRRAVQRRRGRQRHGLARPGADPDGDALTYAWDLDNDGTFETAGQARRSRPRDRRPGERDDEGSRQRRRSTGLSAVDTTIVDVTNAAPTATFNAPATAFAGFSFTLYRSRAPPILPRSTPRPGSPMRSTAATARSSPQPAPGCELPDERHGHSHRPRPDHRQGRRLHDLPGDSDGDRHGRQPLRPRRRPTSHEGRRRERALREARSRAHVRRRSPTRWPRRSGKSLTSRAGGDADHGSCSGSRTRERRSPGAAAAARPGALARAVQALIGGIARGGYTSRPLWLRTISSWSAKRRLGTKARTTSGSPITARPSRSTKGRTSPEPSARRQGRGARRHG